MKTEKQFTASRVNGATTGAHFTTNILLHNESEKAWNDACAALLRRFQPADEIETSVVYEMASTAWRRERAEGVEAQLLDMEIDILDAAGTPAAAPKDELRKVAAAYEGVLSRGRAISEAQRQISRLSRQWRQLHDKLKDLQATRKENIENEPNETCVP